MEKRADLLVEDHGTRYVFQPITAQGREWLEEHAPSEPWEWWGGGLAVEHRYAAPLAEAMIEDGLEID